MLRDLEDRSDRRLPLGSRRDVAELLVEARRYMDEAHDQEMQTLRDLLAIMHEHDLDTLKVKLGDAVYELARREPEPGAPPPAQSPPRRSGRGRRAVAPVRNTTKVLAPLTGVFYRCLVARRRGVR